MNKQKIFWGTSVVALLAGLSVGAALTFQIDENELSQEELQVVQQVTPVVVPLEELYPYTVPPKSTLSAILSKLEVTSQEIHDIVIAAKPVFDLGKIRPGTRFQLMRPTGPEPELVGIRFRFSAIEMLEIRKLNGIWLAEKINERVETRVVTFSGVVKSSLWESAQQANMDPNLIAELAEIFAWQIDFAREVRLNDRWRLSVEQTLVKGEPFGWGSILAAEYDNAGQMHTAVLFRTDGENKGYFAPDGASLRRMFLKSPIKYGRISSRFTMARFHPVLKFNRPHLGVDYAAPKGTPIRAVGGGTIAQAGWNGGAGNMIRIRHNSLYETAYKHLSGFAKGVRPGTRIEQGQTIGYVGNTGLSTGPHLHFEFFKAGRYVDPLGQKFPSADPVPATLLGQFQSESTNLLQSLPHWSTVEASTRQAEPGNL